MTNQEIEIRKEEILAEQRKLNLALKIIQSDSIIPCQGTKMAISQYKHMIEKTNQDLYDLAELAKENVKTEQESVKTETDNKNVNDFIKLMTAKDLDEFVDIIRSNEVLTSEVLRLCKILGI